MNEMFSKKIMDMISKMDEKQLKANLDKVSQVLGNTNSDELMKKLKDEKIID